MELAILPPSEKGGRGGFALRLRSPLKVKDATSAQSLHLIWNADTRMIGRKITGVSGHEQGTMASRGGPDDGVGEPQTLGAPNVHRLIRHGLCDREDFEPVEEVSEEAFLIVSLCTDQHLHPCNHTDGGIAISQQFLARRLDPAKVVNENVCIDDGVH